MKNIDGGIFEGERALFFAEDTNITNATFRNGESPLKESKNITLENCKFEWKYPLWYSKKIKAKNIVFEETARSGVWYAEGVTIKDSTILAPKTFRYSRWPSLFGVDMPNADEALWHCSAVTLNTVKAKGESIGLGLKSGTVLRSTLQGDFLFDGCENVRIEESDLESYSGFCNSYKSEFIKVRVKGDRFFGGAENVKVYDSRFVGKYVLRGASDLQLDNVYVEGDYFGLGAADVYATGMEVQGNYLFDGARDVVIRNSKLISKDAFWNCENVKVENCHIVGEYLGWNSKNITFINCTIESNQGMCYMENVTMHNCTLNNTDLCFEYCKEVDATINSHIDSVKNPISGRIVAKSIGEIIHESDRVDVSATEIIEEEPNV